MLRQFQNSIFTKALTCGSLALVLYSGSILNVDARPTKVHTVKAQKTKILPRTVRKAAAISPVAKAKILPLPVPNPETPQVVAGSSLVGGASPIDFSFSASDGTTVGELSHLPGIVRLVNRSNLRVELTPQALPAPFKVSTTPIVLAPNQGVQFEPVKLNVLGAVAAGNGSDQLILKVKVLNKAFTSRVTPLVIPVSFTVTP